MTRPIPSTLAPLVEQLELDRPELVTLDQLEKMLRALHVKTSAYKAAHRLRERGWLLATGVPGVFEFAPADRAGRISQGDALLPLRAVVTDTPDFPLAAALGTALWLLNITDRGPDTPEVALPKGPKVPRVLQRSFHVVTHSWQLPPLTIRGIPVHRAATVLVHLAHHPRQVRSWAAMLEALPDLVAAAPIEEIAAELGGRPHATKVRLAYLTAGIAPDLARALDIRPAGKVWFGPRGPLRRHDATWNVADAILPFAPIELTSIANSPATDAVSAEKITP